MTKFCGNCGSKINEKTPICEKCGYNNTALIDKSKLNIPNIGDFNINKRAKTKRRIKLALVFTAFIISSVLIFNYISSITGYKGTIRKTMNALEKYDMSTLTSIASEISYHGQDKQKVDQYFSDMVSRSLDQFEATVGHDVHIDYEINDNYILSERKYDEFLTDIEKLYGCDTSNVQEIMALELTVSIEGSKGSSSHVYTDMYLINEDGDWKVYNSFYKF